VPSASWTAKQAAFLTALACSRPPEGRTYWTMQLLTDKLVERRVVEAISDETVRRTLKKRPETLATGALVSADRERGIRLAAGRCAGAVC
jgi:hypothetical protein